MFFFMAGCQAAEPEIARGLPPGYAEANAAFDQRIKQRFPVGTSEKRIVRELEAQSFVVKSHPGWKEASFTKSHIATETVWSVRWTASDSIVRKRWGLCFGRGL